MRNAPAEPFVSRDAFRAVIALGMGSGSLSVLMAAFSLVMLLSNGTTGGPIHVTLVGIAASQLFNALASHNVTTLQAACICVLGPSVQGGS